MPSKTTEEWQQECEFTRARLDRDLEKADTPSKALPIVSKGLAFSAENYFVVRDNQSDGTGAAPEDATRRALRVFEDSARLFTAVELRSMAEKHGCNDSNCYCMTCEDAAEIIEAYSEEVSYADKKAREGA